MFRRHLRCITVLRDRFITPRRSWWHLLPCTTAGDTAVVMVTVIVTMTVTTIVAVAIGVDFLIAFSTYGPSGPFCVVGAR